MAYAKSSFLHSIEVILLSRAASSILHPSFTFHSTAATTLFGPFHTILTYIATGKRNIQTYFLITMPIQAGYCLRTYEELAIDLLTININHPLHLLPLPSIQRNSTLPSDLGWTEDQYIEEYGNLTKMKGLSLYQTGTKGVRLDIVSPRKGSAQQSSIHLTCSGSHRDYNTRVLFKAQSIRIKEIHIRWHTLEHGDATSEDLAKTMMFALEHVDKNRIYGSQGGISVENVTFSGPDAKRPNDQVIIARDGPTKSYYINCQPKSVRKPLPLI